MFKAEIYAQNTMETLFFRVQYFQTDDSCSKHYEDLFLRRLSTLKIFHFRRTNFQRGNLCQNIFNNRFYELRKF